MKTNYFSGKKIAIYTVIGLFSLVLTSCGSYQNKSYYDNDGIYGSDATKKVVNADQKDNQKYKEYFSSLKQENEEVFTDVENYTTNDTVKKEGEVRTNNAWGSNSSETVIVNVYDNSWGMNYWNNYWGWNNWGWNSWYGPNWGWGWNGYYGNPYCYNGWNNGYYGGNHYAYVNGGRRDNRTSYFPNDRSVTINRNSSNPRSFTTTNPRNFNSTNPRNNTTGPRSNASNPRGETTETPRNNTNVPRTNSSNPRGETSDTPRNNTNTNSTPPRNNTNTNSTTPRTNTSTPRSYNDSPRSYTPSNNGGSSSSGGSSGGGRSSGGGGRR